MNRNSELRDLLSPTIAMGRTKKARVKEKLTSFDAGELIPIFLEQCVMPGDTIKINLKSIVRMLTPKFPTMDTAFIETFYFWVPWRLIWEHTKEFFGENTTGAWTQTQEYTVPQLKVKFMPWPWEHEAGTQTPTIINFVVNNSDSTTTTFPINNNTSSLKTSWNYQINAIYGSSFETMGKDIKEYAGDKLNINAYQSKSLGDYLGIPDLGFNVKTVTTTTITSTITANVSLGIITNVDEVVKDLLDQLSAYLSATAPVKYISAMPSRAYQLIYDNWFRNQNYIEPINPKTYWGDATVDYSNENCYKGGKIEKINRIQDYFSLNLPEPQKGDPIITPIGTSAPVKTGAINTSFSGEALKWKNADGTDISAGTNLTLGIFGDGSQTGAGGNLTLSSTDIIPSNLYADLSEALGATINAQRYAFATQRILERDARGGTRYPERIKAAFGVSNDNIVMEIPEYLGGARIPLNIKQITQTSESNTTPLGEVGGYSQTNFAEHIFSKSFTEYGLVMGIAAIRTERTYSQGISRDYFKSRLLDFYDPALAFLGMQATMNYEIFADGTSADDEPWGYTWRWQEYKKDEREVNAEFRPTYAQPLLQWTYTDVYGNRPTLSKEWLQEDKERIDRTLAVQSGLGNQFWGDFRNECEYIRVMPLVSIPGLIDHY